MNGGIVQSLAEHCGHGGAGGHRGKNSHTSMGGGGRVTSK